MSHSLRAKIKCLRYKGIITDKDCDRLRKALDNEDVLDKIRAEIEKAMDDFYYDEHDLGVRAGFRFALEIIDNHISGEEQE